MGKSRGHIPLRTCVSCGSKRAKKDLLRLLADKEGMLVVDLKGKGNGRAVYSCEKSECLNSLLKNRRLERLLRNDRKIIVDINIILPLIESENREHLSDLLL